MKKAINSCQKCQDVYYRAEILDICTNKMKSVQEDVKIDLESPELADFPIICKIPMNNAFFRKATNSLKSAKRSTALKNFINAH